MRGGWTVCKGCRRRVPGLRVLFLSVSICMRARCLDECGKSGNGHAWMDLITGERRALVLFVSCIDSLFSHCYLSKLS